MRREARKLFGYGNGFKEGFDLDPSEVTQLLFFTSGAERSREFVIESVSGAGFAGEEPFFAEGAVVPEPGGELLGPGNPVETARQLSAYQGASATVEAEGRELGISFDGVGQSVHYSSPTGR